MLESSLLIYSLAFIYEGGLFLLDERMHNSESKLLQCGMDPKKCYSNEFHIVRKFGTKENARCNR